MTPAVLTGVIASGTGHDSLAPPMIPGAREPGMLTTFDVKMVDAVVIPDGPSTMDAATIAAHRQDGGGGPNQRRRARNARWTAWAERLRHFATG